MKMLFGLSFITGFCLLSFGNGFAPAIKTSIKPNLMVRNMDAAAIQEIEAARSAFVLCLAGALGSAAVGREGEFWFVVSLSSEWIRFCQLKE